MFYGWILLCVMCLMNFFAVGSIFFSLGVIAPYMIEAMGWTRTQVSIGFAIMTVFFGISGIVAAFIMKKIGIRLTVLAGGFITASGLVITYYSDSIYMYYTGFGILVGFGMAMQTVVPCSQVITNWFVRRRSRCMGFFLSSSGLGAFVMAPIYFHCITHTDNWRIAILIMLVTSFTAALIGFIFIREKPEDMALYPDGIDPETIVFENRSKQIHKFKVYITKDDWEVRPALVSYAYWFIVIGGFITLTGGTIANSHVVLHLLDLGIAPVLASSALGLQNIFSTSGRLITAGLGDRFDPRYLLAVGLLLECISFIVLCAATLPVLVYVFVVLFGVGYGLGIVSGITVLANYFGTKNFATLMAIRIMVITCIAAAGPILSGIAADTLGSYRIVFYTYSGLTAITCVFMLFILRPPIYKAKQAIV